MTQPHQTQINNLSQRILNAAKIQIIRHSKASPEKLAVQVNAVIRGFIAYNVYCTKRDAFLYVDLMISKLLVEHGINPEIHTLILSATNATDIPYVGVKPEANPYDCEWEIYFEEWEHARRFYKPKGQKKLEYYFRLQEGICPVCNTEVTGVFAIHKKESGNVHTLVLMHPECHAKIHD